MFAREHWVLIGIKHSLVHTHLRHLFPAFGDYEKLKYKHLHKDICR